MKPIYLEKNRFSIYKEYIEIPGFFKPKKILLEDIIKIEINDFFGSITFFTKEKKYKISSSFKQFNSSIVKLLEQKIDEENFLKELKQIQIDNNPTLKEAQEYFNTIKENKSVPTIHTDLFLKDKEEAILLEDNSAIEETRAVRRSSGGFGGVRIAKGVSIGGYSGTSSSSQEWKTLDYGILVLTNKRLIYTGQKETRDILLTKIVSAKIEKGLWNSYSLEINTSNRKKSMRFSITGNHYIWSSVLQLLRQGADLLNIEKDIDISIDI